MGIYKAYQIILYNSKKIHEYWLLTILAKLDELINNDFLN